MAVVSTQTYNLGAATPVHAREEHRRRRSSLDNNAKFTAHCNGALAKIRLSYIRLLAREKVEGRELVRRRNSKVTPVYQFGKPATFTKRTITRTVSFSN